MGSPAPGAILPVTFPNNPSALLFGNNIKLILMRHKLNQEPPHLPPPTTILSPRIRTLVLVSQFRSGAALGQASWLARRFSCSPLLRTPLVEVYRYQTRRTHGHV